MLQSGQAIWDAASVKALALHVQATLIPPVEQLLLVDYPLRAPPAADAAPPTAGFKLDEVSVSLKVTLRLSILCRALHQTASSSLPFQSSSEPSLGSLSVFTLPPPPCPPPSPSPLRLLPPWLPSCTAPPPNPLPLWKKRAGGDQAQLGAY